MDTSRDHDIESICGNQHIHGCEAANPMLGHIGPGTFSCDAQLILT